MKIHNEGNREKLLVTKKKKTETLISLAKLFFLLFRHLSLCLPHPNIFRYGPIIPFISYSPTQQQMCLGLSLFPYSFKFACQGSARDVFEKAYSCSLLQNAHERSVNCCSCSATEVHICQVIANRRRRKRF